MENEGEKILSDLLCVWIVFHLLRLRFPFFFMHAFQSFRRQYVLFSGSHALFTEPTNLFFNKNFIKNESHGTIHTFKNYFVTVFSVFSKISVI